jgi:hypothetical protein
MLFSSPVIIAALAQLCLALWGGFVTVNKPWAEKHKVLVLCVIFVLVSTGLSATLYQSHRSALASLDLTNALGRLAKAADESTRVNQLNTQLQQRLLEQSSSIGILSTRAIDIATGGDSFCYIDIGRAEYIPKDSLDIALLGEGNFPLSQISIRIVDLDVLDASLLEGRAKHEMYFNFPLPDHYTGRLRRIGAIDRIPANVDSKRFSIFINASNGVYTQILRLRRVDGAWLSATRVTASYYDARAGIVLDRADKGFPTEILKADADWMSTSKLKRIKVRSK